MTKIVDAKGKLCPEPLVMAKKGLGQIDVGETMKLYVDNKTSEENVARFLKDNGHTVETVEDNGVYVISVIKQGKELNNPDAEEYCPVPVVPKKPHAIVIQNDKMGCGVDELGLILMKGFINTIGEVDPLPGTIVFYNAGVHLAVEGSTVIETLKKLEEAGVKILVCGTCLDYYKNKQDLKAGIVSNMYDILESVTSAGHVIYP